jgi:hypothetical protein
MKKIVTEKGRDDIDFEDTIENLISMLQQLSKEGWTDIVANWYGEYKVYNTSKKRLETDYEYKSRIEHEADLKQNRRKQYEALKKEFGEE